MGPHFEISLEVFINSLDGIELICFTKTASSSIRMFYQNDMDFGLGIRISEDGPDIDLSDDVNMKEWFNISIYQYPVIVRKIYFQILIKQFCYREIFIMR